MVEHSSAESACHTCAGVIKEVGKFSILEHSMVW